MWRPPARFLNEVGKISDEKRHEFLLPSGTLGPTILVDAMQNRKPPAAPSLTFWITLVRRWLKSWVSGWVLACLWSIRSWNSTMAASKPKGRTGAARRSACRCEAASLSKNIRRYLILL